MCVSCCVFRAFFDDSHFLHTHYGVPRIEMCNYGQNETIEVDNGFMSRFRKIQCDVSRNAIRGAWGGGGSWTMRVLGKCVLSWMLLCVYLALSKAFSLKKYLDGLNF